MSSVLSDSFKLSPTLTGQLIGPTGVAFDGSISLAPVDNNFGQSQQPTVNSVAQSQVIFNSASQSQMPVTCSPVAATTPAIVSPVAMATSTSTNVSSSQSTLSGTGSKLSSDKPLTVISSEESDSCVLTHIIEGFVIREGPVPFPVSTQPYFNILKILLRDNCHQFLTY